MQPALIDIKKEIVSAIQNDDLVLPTMPEVAIRLREAAEDKNADAASIAAVIGSDAALSARIIKVANSPLVRGVQTVQDLQMAISRMGIAYTANLATGIAMEQLFQATSDAVDQRMRETWEHSTEVASLSHVLCAHFTDLSPDKAALAGLIHEIGVLPILAWADDQDWDPRLIESVCKELHPELGCMILEAWDFPKELTNVPLSYTEFTRVSKAADYVDIVMVANLHSHSGTEHPFAKMDWTGVHAFDNLGMNVDIIFAENEELSNEVSAAKNILN
jgi:HD-like signal output (HDOD) protein